MRPECPKSILDTSSLFWSCSQLEKCKHIVKWGGWGWGWGATPRTNGKTEKVAVTFLKFTGQWYDARSA